MEKQRLQFLFQKPEFFCTLKDKEDWELTQAQISSNDCFLATHHLAQNKQKIKIWELMTQKCRKIIDLSSENYVICMEFNSENTHFFFAQYNESKVNIVNLLKRTMDINVITTGQQITRIAFNLNYQKVIIIPRQQKYFEIWNIQNRQKILRIKTQNQVINAKYLNAKIYLTVSISQDNFTLYQLRDEQTRIIKEWKAKYISGEMKIYQVKSNQLIVDFRVEFDHYIQIWSLINQKLMKQIFNGIQNFLINNLIGFKLIIEDSSEEDDEEIKDDDAEIVEINKKEYKYEKHNQQSLYETFVLYDLLTGKKLKGLSYIVKDSNYKILPNCTIGQRIQQRCSELAVYQSSFPKSLQY